VIFIVSKEPESATLYAHKLLLVVVCYLGSDYILLLRTVKAPEGHHLWAAAKPCSH